MEPLDDIISRVDALDAMAAMLFATHAGVPTGGEPFKATTFAAEYVCLRMLKRGPVVASGFADPVLVEDLAEQAAITAIGTAFRLLTPPSGDPTGIETDARHRFALISLALYDPAIPELEGDRWPQLFAPVADELEKVTSVSIEQVDRLVQCLSLRSMGWCLHHAGARRRPTGALDLLQILREGAVRGRGMYVEAGSGRMLAATRQQLARGASVPLAAVDAFLRLFATTPGSIPNGFVDQVWHFRRRPVVLWDNLILMPVMFDLMMAIRPTLEAVLRTEAPQAGTRYDKHKATWVEDRSRALLVELTSPDEAFRSLRIPAREPGHDGAERDGLVRIDTVGIAVEAKGGGISLSARRGRVDSQDETLKRLVHEGVAQADGLIAALKTGAEVTGIALDSQKRVLIEMGDITRWIPLVVTLEDMSGVVAASHATFAGRNPADPHPIVVTLDDLAWFGRELTLTAEVIHYLAVRERIARSTARLTVHDEADWFQTYLAGGGAGVQRLLSAFSNLDVPILTRGLDARRGNTDPSYPRWRSPFFELLARWQNERNDGWIEASLAILDLDEDQAILLKEGLAPLRAKARDQNDMAMLTLRPMGDTTIALHVGIPSEPIELTMEEAAEIFNRSAPDASLHVVLSAATDDSSNLQLQHVFRLMHIE